ncbi:hypothetical protein GEMRC1_008666 [Eukaryota sp. GEM-RC1]
MDEKFSTHSAIAPSSEQDDAIKSGASIDENQTHPFLNDFLLNTPSSSQHSTRVAVYCRLAPSSSPTPLIDRPSINSVSIQLPKDTSDTTINISKERWTFPFTSVLTEDNLAVFNETVLPAVNSLFRNISSTFFLYGGRSSGKTYTLFGPSDRTSPDSLGVAPLTFQSIFDRVENHHQVYISFLEIKNDEVYDLLQTSSDADGNTDPCQLDTTIIRNVSDTATVSSVPGLSIKYVPNLRLALQTLSEAVSLRRNVTSQDHPLADRSHVIVDIHLVSQKHQTRSKLCCVDLAAAVKTAELPLKGLIRNEGLQINKSLFFLESVLTAIVSRKPHVPYRNCALTSLLRFNLSHAPKLVIMACLSLSSELVSESLATCLFFRRIGLIKGVRDTASKPNMKQILKDHFHALEGSNIPSISDLLHDLMDESNKNPPRVGYNSGIDWEDPSPVSLRTVQRPSSLLSRELSTISKDGTILDSVVKKSSLLSEQRSNTAKASREVSVEIRSGFQQSSSAESSDDSENAERVTSDKNLLIESESSDYTRTFNFKKFGAFLFYLSIVCIFIYVFSTFSFAAVYAYFHVLLCPSSLVFDAGTYAFGPDDTTWTLHQGATGVWFDCHVYFNFDFDSSPQVFLSIESIESSEILNVDLRLRSVFSDHFAVRISTRRPSFINKLAITWIAVDQSCLKETKSYLYGGFVDFDPTLYGIMTNVSHWSTSQMTPLRLQMIGIQQRRYFIPFIHYSLNKIPTTII